MVIEDPHPCPSHIGRAGLLSSGEWINKLFFPLRLRRGIKGVVVPFVQLTIYRTLIFCKSFSRSFNISSFLNLNSAYPGSSRTSRLIESFSFWKSCISPSASMISFFSQQKKSTTNLSIECSLTYSQPPPLSPSASGGGN